MMRIVSKNRWRTKEPGDVPGQMGETIFQGAIDLLFDGGYMTVDELLREFCILWNYIISKGSRKFYVFKGGNS